MSESPFDRRKFNRLTAAAFGGLAAGSLLGCGGGDESGKGNVAANADVHLCRGLNDCKGKGKGGDNECRGQGKCATAKEHSCGTLNDCKGLGGCGETAGANDCAGKGGCAVPLMDSAWNTVRNRMVEEWTAAGEEFGTPPPKKEEPAAAKK